MQGIVFSLNAIVVYMVQVLVRIADIKFKTQEGELAAKVERFLVIISAHKPR